MRAALDEAFADWPMLAANAARWRGAACYRAETDPASYLLAGAGDAVLVGAGAADLAAAHLTRDVGFVMAPPASGVDDLLGSYGLAAIGDWTWMSCTTPPKVQPGEDRVGVLATDVETLADAQRRCNPDTHVHPGDPGLTWWGYTADDGVIAGICAVHDVPRPGQDGYEPTAGISLAGLGVDPSYRRRGIGAAMMAAITRAGLAVGPLVHYGVWLTNEPALRIYRRLGYRDRQRVRGFSRR